MEAETRARTGSLGTQLRGKLAAAYASRGHHCSSLWYVYSPRTVRDWVLKNDLEWGHFLLAESDPGIKDIDYSPSTELVHAGDEGSATSPDAVVTLRDGTIEWREIGLSSAFKNKGPTETILPNGARYARYTEQDVYACPQRIANWTRVIAWLAAVRGRSLYPECIKIAAMLHARGSVSIGEIQRLSPGADSACFVAAAFKGIQDGLFVSSLNEKPLSTNTLVTATERQT